jgi:transposase
MEAVLSPSPAELRLGALRIAPGKITITAVAKRRSARCPSCGVPSQRVHSRYVRRLADLPWHGIPVKVELQSRRFFCGTSGCLHRIFTARLPQTVPCYGRQTRRLRETHRQIAYALGGEAGARLAEVLGLSTSADTLLRRVKQVSAETRKLPTPRYLGVDEWAWKKGKRYGTLLCDLERGCVIDLLPERSAESLAAWLQAHPGVELISRDRSPLFAGGASLGAPDAVQVADRWHLFRNLAEALQKILEQQHARLRRAASAAACGTVPPPASSETAPPRAIERRKQANRQRRLARYQEVVELRERGLAKREIARRVGLDRRTVRGWLEPGSFPERKERAPRQRLLDSYLSYLQQRWEEGVTNAALLFREIRAQGYRGTSCSPLRDLVASWRTRGPPPPGRRRSALASPRQSAWMLVLSAEDRTAEQPQQAYLEQLEALWQEVKELERLAREFIRLFQEHDPGSLGAWLEAADRTPLRGFARGLFSDLKAIRAAMTLPWSNGPTEGHINRLKMLKRQMYGRAGFELLRVRVLTA